MATSHDGKNQKPHTEQPESSATEATVSKANNAPHHRKQPDATDDRPRDKKKPKLPPWARTWRNWQKFIAISEVILAAAIAWFAWQQADLGSGQLVAMKSQNAEMIKQSKAALAQLAVAEGQLKQNEQTLELMRVEQRAWLATSAEPIKPVEDLRNLTLENFKDFTETTNWKVRLRNSGNTPAVLKYSRVGWLPSERWQAHDKDFWRDDLTKQAMTRPQHTIVAPDDSLVFGMQDINQAYAIPLDVEMRMKQWVGASTPSRKSFPVEFLEDSFGVFSIEGPVDSDFLPVAVS